MEKREITSKSLWIVALILSLGFIASSGILAYALKNFNANNNSITVKGLAEKPILHAGKFIYKQMLLLVVFQKHISYSINV